jgi:hypothetical protein
VNISRLIFAFCLFIFGGGAAAHAAAALPKDPKVPPLLAFQRSIELEGFLQASRQTHGGAQSFRIRSRNVDPDVNAFVGLVAGFHHFNDPLRLGDPEDPFAVAEWMGNAGIDIGIIRGKHLLELDLMGALLSQSLGPAVALAGEYRFHPRVIFAYRAEANIFSKDLVADVTPSLRWMPTSTFGLTAGYRFFASRHMNRNGPQAGIILRFQHPKIPFLFPSLG